MTTPPADRHTRAHQLLRQHLGMTRPLMLAPLSGGAATPALVAAVAASGCLGVINAGALSADRLATRIRAVQSLTDGALAVHLHLDPPADLSDARIRPATERIPAIARRLGVELDMTAAPPAANESWDPMAQLSAAMDAGITTISVSFGIPAAGLLAKVHEAGGVVIGTATNVLEGIVLEEAGVDAVVAQGAEAGGERGTFLGSPDDAMIGTLPLVQALADHLAIPIVAAGGISDGRGIAAALSLGASAVQMGTAFLGCDESGLRPAQRRLLAERGNESATVMTRQLSGRLGRALDTGLIRLLEADGYAALPHPLQARQCAPLVDAATRANNIDGVALWAGQGCGRCQGGPAAALITAWTEEAWRQLRPGAGK